MSTTRDTRRLQIRTVYSRGSCNFQVEGIEDGRIRLVLLAHSDVPPFKVIAHTLLTPMEARNLAAMLTGYAALNEPAHLATEAAHAKGGKS